MLRGASFVHSLPPWASGGEEALMQLTFTPEELHALVGIMLAFESEARTEENRKTVRPLANKILAHDLHLASDELEDLETLLQAHAAKLRSVMDCTTASSVLDELNHQRTVVQRILDKVTEACAMV
jgi:hypothetical protein